MRKFIPLLLAVALVFGAFSASLSAQDEPIRVGSKQFTEQLVLGQIMLLALEDAGFAVEDQTNLGPTEVNRQSLLNGEIDVYADYTGTALFNYFNDVDWANIPVEAYGDPVMGYGIASSLDAAINDIVWLEPPPANNAYFIAVPREFAEANDVYDAFDFADYVNDGGEVYMVTNEEFAQRPDGVASFEQTYGFDMTEDQMLIIAQSTPAQTLQALNEGSNNVNMAMTYGTAGANSAYDIVLIEDPLGAQPIYAPTPMFRGEIIRANPEIAGILNPIFRSLDNDTLGTLNAAVDVDGEVPRDVAAAWLTEMGFIGN